MIRNGPMRTIFANGWAWAIINSIRAKHQGGAPTRMLGLQGGGL